MQLLFLFLTVWRSPPSTHTPTHTHPQCSSEQRVGSSLCDDCGPSPRQRKLWQAAELRLHQTGLVYWTSPTSLCAHQCVCVWGEGGACLCVCIFKSLRRLLSSWKDDNDSDHTQGLFSSRHKRGSVHNSSWRTYCTYDVFYDTSEMQCEYVLN